VPRLVYDGPHTAVEVPALRRTVRRGEAVLVEDQALAAALLAQSTWTEAPAPVPAPKPKAEAKTGGES